MAAVLFPQFSLLPPELRRRIWEMAGDPRIVEGYWTSGKSWAFRTHLPSLLIISKESNEIGCRYYYNEKLILPRRSSNSSLSHHPPLIVPRCITWFHHEEDILYIPYQSKCSLSYGIAVDKFLARIQEPMKIHHLALSLPLTRTEVTSMDSRSQKTKYDLNRIVDFFKAVQSKGRMRIPLDLKTLTLVLGDPVMFMKIDDLARHEVRTLSEIEHRDDNDIGNLWIRAIRDCKSSLKAPHSMIDRTRYPQARGTTRNSWGTPEIHFKIVERAESDTLPNGWYGI